MESSCDATGVGEGRSRLRIRTVRAPVREVR